jgi:hypothetical protein
MRLRIAVWTFALALSGCAAPSDRAATPETASLSAATSQVVTAVAQPEADEARIIAGAADASSEVRCIDTAITGSRIPKRVCLTEAQWERWRMDSQELLREWQGPKTGTR